MASTDLPDISQAVTLRLLFTVCAVVGYCTNFQTNKHLNNKQYSMFYEIMRVLMRSQSYGK